MFILRRQDIVDLLPSETTEADLARMDELHQRGLQLFSWLMLILVLCFVASAIDNWFGVHRMANYISSLLVGRGYDWDAPEANGAYSVPCT